jgi:mRNA interferase MazF
MIEFGDIYLVNFEPSLGKEYKKVRPALVVQMERISKRSPYITVMPLSSKIDRLNSDDVFVEMDHKNRLASNSLVKVFQISSFDKRRFIKKIGEANSPVLRKVRGYMRKHFGF